MGGFVAVDGDCAWVGLEVGDGVGLVVAAALVLAGGRFCFGGDAVVGCIGVLVVVCFVGVCCVVLSGFVCTEPLWVAGGYSRLVWVLWAVCACGGALDWAAAGAATSALACCLLSGGLPAVVLTGSFSSNQSEQPLKSSGESWVRCLRDGTVGSAVVALGVVLGGVGFACGVVGSLSGFAFIVGGGAGGLFVGSVCDVVATWGGVSGGVAGGTCFVGGSSWCIGLSAARDGADDVAGEGVAVSKGGCGLRGSGGQLLQCTTVELCLFVVVVEGQRLSWACSGEQTLEAQS